ncbi:ATPase [Streptomyces sp. NBC_00006]|uniref:RapZ C-terminal domain-containing protein n=1 Tax=Streptomyces sp. NBC_00006 TaxID=2975619 RepID=UPI002256C5DE|nr:RNase adapter RapZ [Streptomyces sp. NBC_00006]MCX5528957.1 ATPase [Streptomyces sp. NBC_00006]MCX5537811.1 ATPase [Streptomyces sp. NBC_00006]
MAVVEIVSFGFLHGPLLDENGDPLLVDLTVDLRRHFRDPHVSPQLRYMTADDEPVRRAVLGTPGVSELVLATVAAIEAFASGPSAGTVTVADGCAGGRHRAPVFARALADRLTASGHQVTVQHRDMHRAVVNR